MTEFDAGVLGAAEHPVAPEGKYAAELLDVQVGERPDGTTEWVWSFKLVRDRDYSGMEYVIHTPITPTSMWRVHSICKALGLVRDGRAQFTASEAAGSRCLLELFVTDGVNVAGEVLALDLDEDPFEGR